MVAPLIYNIFPRLAGALPQWKKWADSAKNMGFNWIYFNPFFTTGLSGSLYAIKDYFSVDPAFVSSSEIKGIEELQETMLEIRQKGLKIMFDLVVNHTSIDCPLVKSHPEWFKLDEEGTPVHPQAIDPADARKITVWGDLYEIDNEESSDLEGLYNYWEGFIDTCVHLGASGFRCDAAYKVPAALWKRLITRAEKTAGEKVPFFAETLGCTLEEVEALKDAGFNYLYNSGKYWNFDASWALEQHASFGEIAPSVGFPESHDTPRLAEDVACNMKVAMQRYLFGMAFSEGFQITMGFEYGWTKKPDVVSMTADDQEGHCWDMTDFIRQANALKLSVPVMGEEGIFDNITRFEAPTIILKKSSRFGHAPLYIIINKDWNEKQWIEMPVNLEICRPFQGDFEFRSSDRWIELDQAEVVFGR